MKIYRTLLVLFLAVFFVNLVSSAHYITGHVNDALDGETANGKIVTLWNPLNGQNDNLTDIVGPTGNSGHENIYMIDCELLGAPCSIGDVLSIKIFGDLYITEAVNVTVTSAGYDVADNLSLNSPPVPGLIYPLDGDNTSANVNFNCSYFDYDDDIDSVELWGNWTGSWGQIDFLSVGPESGYAVFSKILSQGRYIWNCLVRDLLGIEVFSTSNNTFFVDTTSPVITGIDFDDSLVCGFSNVLVNCTTYDSDTGINQVLIESLFDGNPVQNYTADFVSGDVYRASVLLNSVGNWSFRCYASDSVGNLNSLLSVDEISVFSGNPEISIFNNEVSFDKSPSVEGEEINVSVIIQNEGCSSANNFIVGFFNEEKPDGNNFQNRTISVSEFSSQNVWALFSAEIGTSNIFVYADLGDSLIEDDKTNNEANNSVYLQSWQKIFGNLSLDKILTGNNNTINMTFWENQQNFAGNIFVADSESQINWLQLQAIGRTKDGLESNNDFLEIDGILGMGDYNDSISEIYTNLGVPKFTTKFTVFQNEIENVAIVNSSESGDFYTGILWDMGDSTDEEYNSTEKQDIVFVSQIKIGGSGKYGIYDYEINIPAKLRNYHTEDTSKVYLYYDLN